MQYCLSQLHNFENSTDHTREKAIAHIVRDKAIAHIVPMTRSGNFTGLKLVELYLKLSTMVGENFEFICLKLLELPKE